SRKAGAIAGGNAEVAEAGEAEASLLVADQRALRRYAEITEARRRHLLDVRDRRRQVARAFLVNQDRDGRADRESLADSDVGDRVEAEHVRERTKRGVVRPPKRDRMKVVMTVRADREDAGPGRHGRLEDQRGVRIGRRPPRPHIEGGPLLLAARVRGDEEDEP